MANSKELAESVTALVIKQLEEGTIPWRKPWNVNGLVPTSLQSGKPYRGINHLILSIMMQMHGYERNLWVTYKQAQALGGNVSKGQKGTEVILWKPLEVKDPLDPDAKKKVLMMKSFHVWNVAQCENLTIPEKFLPNGEWTGTTAESVFAGYVNGPSLSHTPQARAFYSPALDAINLPPKEAFANESDYAETLFHEMTHSTGHESRLNRFTDKEQPSHFGTDPYAREELVAEIGAMMLLSHAGLTVDHANSAAYIKSWINVLNNDHNLIIQASQRASKAVDMILGTTKEEVE